MQFFENTTGLLHDIIINYIVIVEWPMDCILINLKSLNLYADPWRPCHLRLMYFHFHRLNRLETDDSCKCTWLTFLLNICCRNYFKYTTPDGENDFLRNRLKKMTFWETDSEILAIITGTHSHMNWGMCGIKMIKCLLPTDKPWWCSGSYQNPQPSKPKADNVATYLSKPQNYRIYKFEVCHIFPWQTRHSFLQYPYI